MAAATGEGQLYGGSDASNSWNPGLKDNYVYYPTVNANTGEITIRRKGRFGDTIVASKPAKGAWNIRKTVTTDAERTYFGSVRNQIDIVKKSELTSNKAQEAYGVEPDTAKKRTEELLETGRATTDPGTSDTSKRKAKADQTLKSNAKTRNSFPLDLRYPEELGQTQQDVIKFNMLEYSPRGFDAGNFGFKDRRSVTKDKIIGSVILPIPGGISDKNACSWGESTMNAGQAVLGAIALESIKGGFGAGGEVLKDIGKGIRGNTGNLKEAAANAFAGAASGTGTQLLTRTTGAIINPNLELLFNAPTLRPFQFQFRLSPRNSDEAKSVAKIIRFFKQGSAPIKGQSRLFLKSPHTFQLQYVFRGQGESHPFLNKFKECALKSVSVNYTPDGSYSTYEDGSMSSYQVTLEFQELEPVFNDDYEEDQKFGSFREDPAEQAALQRDIPSQIGF
jgi:hypothetical protein